MGHKSNNIIDQTISRLNEMIAFGTSKHQDKKIGATQDKIYSYSTYETYKKQCINFVKYTKQEHKTKTLSDARPYVDEYIKHLIDKGLSPYTIKLVTSSLGKLYQEPTTNFLQVPNRSRSEIFRSRNECVRDKHFSEKNNSTLVEFCRNSGLRRSELGTIKGNCLCWKDEQAYIFVENGKGGKERYVPILNNNSVVIEKILSTPLNERVFPKIHNAFDCHSYRAQFATMAYKSLARPISQLSRDEKYFCRKDLKGTIYDKKALLMVSHFLGHERYNVVALHYLWA